MVTHNIKQTLNFIIMKTLTQFILLLIFVSGFSQNENSKILSPEIQIKTAVLAAPEDHRDQAMVYGYNEQGEMVVLREGSNYFVCLADDPTKKGIQVSCYSKKLEPFMARGRELKAEGKSEVEKKEIRGEEAKAGTLKLPDSPSTLFVLSGSDENYNSTTGVLKDGKFRYVVYIPYATAESTGLAEKPEAPGMPWIMEPGTYRAHIMISPVSH